MARSRQVFPATRRRYVFQATGGATVVGTFYQDPSERLPRYIQMVGQMPIGVTLVQATVVVTDLTDALSPTIGIVNPTNALIVGTLVRATFQSPINGHRYRLEFNMRDSANNFYRKVLLMIGKLTTAAGTFYQDPYERLPHGVQFTASQLPAGVVLNTATVTVNVGLSSSARVIGGLRVEATFQAAVDGQQDEAVFSIKDTLNHRYTEKLIMIGKA